MRRRVDHVVRVQAGFLAVLQNEPIRRPAEGAPPDFADLKRGARSSHEGLRSFAESLDTAGLPRMVRIPWFPDPPCVITTFPN